MRARTSAEHREVVLFEVLGHRGPAIAHSSGRVAPRDAKVGVVVEDLRRRWKTSADQLSLRREYSGRGGWTSESRCVCVCCARRGRGGAGRAGGRTMVCAGRLPVMKLALDGPHTAWLQYARMNTCARPAARASVGVDVLHRAAFPTNSMPALGCQLTGRRPREPRRAAHSPLPAHMQPRVAVARRGRAHRARLCELVHVRRDHLLLAVRVQEFWPKVIRDEVSANRVRTRPSAASRCLDSSCHGSRRSLARTWSWVLAGPSPCVPSARQWKGSQPWLFHNHGVPTCARLGKILTHKTFIRPAVAAEALPAASKNSCSSSTCMVACILRPRPKLGPLLLAAGGCQPE